MACAFATVSDADFFDSGGRHGRSSCRPQPGETFANPLLVPIARFEICSRSARGVREEASIPAVPVPHRVETSYAFAGGLVEVRRYFWTEPLEQTVFAMDDALVINMALTSRPAHTRVERILQGDEDSQIGEAGRLLVMIPRAPYHLVAPSGTLRSLHCAIDCERFEQLAGEKIDWSALGPFSGEWRSGLGIETQMARIHEELIRGGLGREMVIKACIDIICVELSRQFRRGRPARPDVLAGVLATWRMRSIMTRIQQPGPAPRVTELADICGLTERQLSRAFKAETGQTIGRFIEEVTMERAHRLLMTTEKPLGEVARELGFASSDSFAQSYRRHTGTSPSKVRRR
ncbi:helix-turn-helix domain-containing protein [Novosphingobium sp. JCM 18896]|uniref:helix-turn-helix domain-containing protein n=1 Tax=Novosphingobium sp. JCM 18896 TaxID=2989731 RepID=UPI00222308F6|nr:AraC family transcriptional regulator [Novosphingobium sp. JCM 18896]MCW1431624.1 helix-turn-helix transcriptional regulator [Novosphingobium sp. JCM 18896]